MKKIYFLLLALGLFTGVNAQIINFPDANFKSALIQISPNPYSYRAQDINGNYITIDTNNNGEIEVNEALNVYKLFITYNNTSSPFLTNLTGIEYFTNLIQLDCKYQRVTFLNLTALTQLKDLECSENRLNSLNISGLSHLEKVVCRMNSIPTLNLTGLSNLNYLDCGFNQIGAINATQSNNLQNLNCERNQLTTLNVSGLANLQELNCYTNNLSGLNLSGLLNLKKLNCAVNVLPILNLSGLSNLEELFFNQNPISTIDLSVTPNLKKLSFGANLFTGINISMLNNLETLGFSSGITNLDASGLENLTSLSCYFGNLTSLNLSGCKNLFEVDCSNNQITSLDVSDCVNLYKLNCSSNQLVTLNLKNSYTYNWYYSIHYNPNLQYICADENEVAEIQGKANNAGYTNCQVNSYCTFTPGGVFYTIQGNNRLDSNSNGCDTSDLPLASLKFNITDGTASGNIISNVSGNYSMPVQAGTHTVTPILENPGYFNVSPSSLNVTFPTQSNPFTQDFCVTPNGIKQDLEVIILPLVPSRPGFDAKFKIIYKNKGTTVQSGSVVVDYFNNLADFVSSTPVLTSETANLLTWDYANLQPLEVREITFTVNINSPSETPAVNIGDILSFESYIYPVIGDLTTNDNHSGFRQVVVGSFDPNDKTCLEGTTITPDKVGEYVHYMIRFENTGTFPAENIVVKDMIDTAKFDINSLVPIKGSHSFVTKIADGNKVEFIFENINLPFNDANNDGYVAFKIKTKPTLVNGDTFSNSASIYFDYNFPIVTNTATTTIAVLSRQDFEFSNYFNLYPNPVHDVLNIATKENIEITSVNIYNTLGQLVLVIPNAQNSKTIDVSNLTSGNYFIKINSDKGTSNTKFIKN